MPGRKFVSGEEYRFGFNGQEEEILRLQMETLTLAQEIMMGELADGGLWILISQFILI
ncbi:hypothetical protein [Saprospira grandis]|uniref:Uncharacterized protein n=1 Tax=Saprospira grandis (strain Lewin) TaxID=984262 RepID=H6L7F6_SAPGL|nr:hypothetical protein [Saprospira grandis]AFC26828.1 hypothetical protein SGRA_4113 [Saprospira grandis str. Lewin]